jgi:phosphatidylserine synthase
MTGHSTTKQRVGLVAAATFLSWLGLVIHNTMELGAPPWSWESGVPAVVALVLFLGWWQHAAAGRVWGWLLWGWTLFAHLLLGALLSVLPLPLWPFSPEQSISHYLAHVIYAVAQLPLLWLLWRDLRRT